MKTWIITGVVAILLLTAGAILLVNRLTELPESRPLPAGRLAPVDLQADHSQPPAPGSSSFVDADPGAPIVIPPRPDAGGPVQNESAPIRGPAPMALPADPEAQGEAIDEVRRQRTAEQLERRNRRNLERAAGAAQAPPPRSLPSPADDQDR